MNKESLGGRVEKPKDAPLARALRKPLGPLTHIRYLDPSENGSNCNCTCPGCGADLVAVNADKDEEYLRRPRVRRPYFRHQAGQQRGKCLDRAARAAAVYLFMTEDVVWLPPRSWSTAFDVGHPSVVKPSERVLVAERRWLDSLTGILVLEDGRQIAVTLDAMSMVDVEGYDFVLDVKCSDPVIATMSPEEILTQLQADASAIACWIRHSEDTEQRKALQTLEDEYLAGMPPELVEGMSKLHANETVLRLVTC